MPVRISTRFPPNDNEDVEEDVEEWTNNEESPEFSQEAGPPYGGQTIQVPVEESPPPQTTCATSPTPSNQAAHTTA